jgi:hypothetical protein
METFECFILWAILGKGGQSGKWTQFFGEEIVKTLLCPPRFYQREGSE